MSVVSTFVIILAVGKNFQRFYDIDLLVNIATSGLDHRAQRVPLVCIDRFHEEHNSLATLLCNQSLK